MLFLQGVCDSFWTVTLSLSHIPAAKLSPSNGETTFLKAKKYETVQEKRRDAEKGSRGAPVPSNRTMLIVIAYGGVILAPLSGTARALYLLWSACCRRYGALAVPLKKEGLATGTLVKIAIQKKSYRTGRKVTIKK